MDHALQRELNALIENALKLKRENEELQAQVKEAGRLLRACNPDDLSDVRLTLRLVKEIIVPTIH